MGVKMMTVSLSQGKLLETSHTLIPKIEAMKPETEDDKMALRQGFYTQKQMESIFENGIKSSKLQHCLIGMSTIMVRIYSRKD